MGYAATYFQAHVADWIRNGWLPPGGFVADLGSQEFTDDQAATTESVSSFIGQAHKVGLVADVYRVAGFNYQSFDVDSRFGSTYADLNVSRVPKELARKFDVVNNEGTIEHLANPINGFRFAHDLAKVGGIMHHSSPLSGWQDHGLFHPTLRFYDRLASANGYEIAKGWVDINAFHRNDRSHLARDYYVRCQIPGMPQSEFWGLDKWLHIVFRKTRDTDFAITVDHIEDEVVAERVRIAFKEAG